MSDLQVLRELAAQVLPPQYGDLVSVARKRRRRSALAAASGVAVLVMGAAIAGAALSGSQRVLEPAPVPTSDATGSPSPSDGWTPERIRAEGTSEVLVPPTEAGLSVRQYGACEGEPPCRDVRLALEVTQDERSALFDLRGELPSFVPAWVKVHDDDSVLVQDLEDAQSDGLVRFRLLRADGDEIELQMAGEPAPAVPGPDVVVIDDYADWTQGMSSVQDVYLLDEAAGTLRPLDVPDGVVDQWIQVAEDFLWGVTGDCRVYWTSGDDLEERRLDCNGEPLPLSETSHPSGWLQSGRMAVVDFYDVPDDGRDDVNRIAVHVSLDSGATWERIDVGRYDDDTWTDKLAVVLDQVR